MPKRHLPVMATALLIALPVAAVAQDMGSRQAVGLFSQCIRFTGDPAGLRAFIASKDLPLVPSDQASWFADGKPSQVFGASTPYGAMALVSQDDGACRVVMESGDPAAVRDALMAEARSLILDTSVLSTRGAPGRDQTVYRMSGHGRQWTVSVTGLDASQAGPARTEVVLLATSG